MLVRSVTNLVEILPADPERVIRLVSTPRRNYMCVRTVATITMDCICPVNALATTYRWFHGWSGVIGDGI